ncbi:MAG: heparan-alpha-glucosaminide N-acetyltransferase domain-containing protein, partial [Actinomycetota bacterium]
MGLSVSTPTTLPTRSGLDRNPSLDATRAIALLGIIVLNYHGYLNGYEAIGADKENFFVRIMDAWNGVLAPSPVIFVLVSGISCSLFASANFDRWTLVRRGVLLFTLGSMFEWVWNGTILPYFGLYFVLAAGLVTWSRRNIALIAIVCTVSAAALSMWRFFRERDFHSTAWLNPSRPDTPRNFVFRYFVDYTHPILPWFTFFCVGLLVGRSLPWFFANRRRLFVPLAAAVAAVYTLSTVVRRGTDGAWQQLTSTDPFERGVLATLGVTLSALLVVIVVSWVVEAFPSSPITDVFVRAGRISLTLYVLHGLAYNLVINRLELVRPTGLDTALGLSVLMWVLLVSFGA